jgi:ABC-type nitrate/sulfonate/bicarbonate transport system permease component
VSATTAAPEKETTMPAASTRVRRSAPRLAGLRGLIPLALLLALWQFFGGSDPLRYPQPSRWIDAIVQLNANGVLLPALGHSLLTFSVGLALAIVIGGALGLLVGSLPRVDRALNPLFDFLRGLPVPVLVPVTILVLGVGLGSSIFIVVFAIVWPILLNTALARRSLSSVRMDMARMLGFSRGAQLAKVVIPSVFPAAMVGVRISASLGVITTLVVEMISGGKGAGFLLMERQSRYDAPGMWGVLLIIGIFGFAMNAVLGLVEKRALRNWPTNDR